MQIISKAILSFLFALFLTTTTFAETQTIHIFVALCDNEFQGIVPVPKSIGNGKDPGNNLYWGAGYGVKTFLNKKTTDWKLIGACDTDNPLILERILFKHKTEDIYLLADAYDGEHIKTCTRDFLKASNNQEIEIVFQNNKTLAFGGGSDLVAYIGHDGLMEFDVEIDYDSQVQKTVDVIILACYSKDYFSPHIQQAKANPVLWTTHLMAPEAYTLKAAIDGWILKEDGKSIDERAAQMYHKYQKCGIKGARGLFTTGF